MAGERYSLIAEVFSRARSTRGVGLVLRVPKPVEPCPLGASFREALGLLSKWQSQSYGPSVMRARSSEIATWTKVLGLLGNLPPEDMARPASALAAQGPLPGWTLPARTLPLSTNNARLP